MILNYDHVRQIKCYSIEDKQDISLEPVHNSYDEILETRDVHSAKEQSRLMSEPIEKHLEAAYHMMHCKT